MGLWSWVKSWFVSPPVVRDVAGMMDHAVGSDVATREEVVDTSGKPLKPGHRRRALRDKRLLPKPKPTGSFWGRKKPKVMDEEEADRLFSETLRTRDRNIRDLVADEDQLQRLGLPVWTSEADVASALGLSIKQLRHFSIHRQRDAVSHYVIFAIRKRSGGQRLIHAPKKRLKAIQRSLHEQLVSKLPVSPYAHGFRSGHSVATNAAPHVGKAVVIKLDIADCFPTIHLGRVRGLLIAYGYSYPVAQTLAVLMTEPPRQPVELDGKIYPVPVGSRFCVQGAPTSPGLCNAILRRLDHRLAGLARKHEFGYTRYADDLTFSGDARSKIKLLITIAARIAHEEGLPLNRKKTRVLRAGQRQSVTGVVVNQSLGLSRQERRRIRAALHQQSKTSDPLKARQLRGKIAYVRMLNPAQAEGLEKAE
ncbi:MAG TPA: reverse transcriptase family protein [Gemmataceae bacterium]|nr:reverse transcriptase family protein [Gemmataceae bacterium]